MKILETQQCYVTAQDERGFSAWIEGRNTVHVLVAESAKMGNKLGRDGMEITDVETRTWYCPERGQHEFSVKFRVKHKLAKADRHEKGEQPES